MAKSLGEINYEFLVAFFGAVEGHEGFFTSDDGEEVLVIPQDPRADVFVEGGTGVFETVPAQIDSVKAVKGPRVDASTAGGASAFARFWGGVVALGRALARLMRRGTA